MTAALRRHSRGPAALLCLALAAIALAAAAGPAQAQSWSGTWTFKQSSPTPPAGRGWVDLIFDEAIGRSVLFGGSGEFYNNDILHYDALANTWAQAEAGVTCAATNWFFPPTPRDEHAVEYDSVQRLYWTFGGSGFGCVGSLKQADAGTTTIVLVDAALTATTADFYRDWIVQLSASGAKALVQSYDPATKRLTLRTTLSGLVPGASYYLYTQGGGGTWYYDPVGRDWTSLAFPFWGYTGPLPAHRFSPAFAYSPVDRVILMFGGANTGYFNDTWVIDTVARRWVQKKADGTPGSPPGLLQLTNSMVYDSVNNVFVLFGGRCPPTGIGCSGTSGETWVYRYSTNTWTNMHPSVRPPARQQHQMAFDRHNGVTVLFGGNNGSDLSDTWVYHYPSNTWAPVSTPTAPGGRHLGAIAYDTVNRVSVLYGGVITSGGSSFSYRDVWTLSLFGSTSPNPVPVLSAISPTSAAAGGAGFTLTATGASFAPTAVVRWNGSPRPTTFDSTTQLRATISAADIAAEGTASVTVFNPAPGGGVSSPRTFTITAGSPPPPPGEIVIDNAPQGVADASRSFTGTWCVSVAPGPLGPNSLFSCGSGIDTYRWTPAIPAARSYDVYVRWTQHPNRSTAVPIAVQHAGGLSTRTFNEQTGGSAWVLHGRYSFNTGTGGFVQVNSSAGQAAADAVRFVPAAAEIVIDNAPLGVQDPAGGRTFTGTWCLSEAPNPLGSNSLFSCGGGPDTYRWTPTIPATAAYDVYVRWTQHPNRSTAVPITVTHAGGNTARTFNEQSGGSAWVLHGRYTFNGGTGGFVQVTDAAGQAAADGVRFVPVP